MQQSRVAEMATSSKRKKSVRKLQGVDSIPKQQQPVMATQSNPVQPPPNPMKAVGGGPPPVPGVPGATVPPPVPNANPQPGLNSQPPPIPNVPGVAVPPPVPQQQRLTPQEMAERSRN